MSLDQFLGLISGEEACNEPKQVEIDSSDSVLTSADLAWSISGWRMTDEVVMLKGKRLLVTVTGGAQDWNDFGDENLFEVEFRNDLIDSPLAVDWKVLMVVVAVRVDDRTNDWVQVRVRVRVKLMRAMAMVVIDRYQC
ncbi:hypothetical protein PPACK8108_LOCUS16466 [Phakopsora pachyrhizi]|uniref:Uncharacterized protein n=1 Tax=Phakopsora pachyrhizi TaxID=170000 RepID=A0AAV0BAH6_PHAPC|nr:hypothetical protein PPACK8108_LOCUS16466 [Phakopsora pachyrhizi]